MMNDSVHSEGQPSPRPPRESPSPSSESAPTFTKARRRPSQLQMPKRSRHSQAHLYSPEAMKKETYSPDDVGAGRKTASVPSFSPDDTN
eukprot:scaffold101_cov123-Cylindrotheca_fusiformis.AAC.14